MQTQLADLARKHGFPFIGPNCPGIYVPGRIDTFFIPSERMVRPEPGKVVLVSKSGGVLVDQMTKFADLSSSVQSIASLKNPIDLTGSATDGDFMAAADMIESIDLNPVMCSAKNALWPTPVLCYRRLTARQKPDRNLSAIATRENLRDGHTFICLSRRCGVCETMMKY